MKQIIIYDSASGDIKRVAVALGDIDPSDRQTLDAGESMMTLDTPQDVTGMIVEDGSLVADPAYTDELADIKDDWVAAVSEKDAAVSAYQSASTDGEKLDAVAQYTLAQDSQIDAIRQYLQLEEGPL